MIVLKMRQGTPEWLEARMGRPTASQCGRILTAKKLEYAAGAGTYRNELLCEWVTGYPFNRGGDSIRDRGTDMEAEARAWYELEKNVDVREVGFLMRDDGLFGGSPDSLVGDEGGLEIKCPLLHTHVGYLLDSTKLVDEYRPQCQGLMNITGRPWWDLLSYSPLLPKVLVRVERDETWQAAFGRALETFLDDLTDARRRLAAMGVQPAPSMHRLEASLDRKLSA